MCSIWYSRRESDPFLKTLPYLYSVLDITLLTLTNTTEELLQMVKNVKPPCRIKNKLLKSNGISRILIVRDT